MNRKLKNTTRRWLEAEYSSNDAVAQEALARLFALLPTPKPSPALERRVFEQLGLVTAAGATPHWAFRWVVAIAMALSGLATAVYAPTLAGALSVRGSFNWIVDLGAGILTATFRRFASGYTLWEVVARAGATAAEAVATPQTLAAMLATVLFGLATFRVLASLVAVERSSHHA